MQKIYDACAKRMKDATGIACLAGLAGWDQHTMMPPRGAGARSEQLSALTGVLHQMIVDPQYGEHLHKLSQHSQKLSRDQRVCVREWLHDYERAIKLPPDLVREMSRTVSLAQQVWVKARKDADFASFAPWLSKIIELKRRTADALGFTHHPYDALLDGFESGMTIKELDPVLENLREGLVPIAHAIKETKPRAAASFLTQKYPEPCQERLCQEIMLLIGVDPLAARLDRSAHPFCSGIATGDVRITTRYHERNFLQSFYSVMHESGHALYEQGLLEKYYGTPLNEAVSLGIHESQSRLWENFIGRSLPFIHFILPVMRKHLGKPLQRIRPQQLYQALNRVSPGSIRIEADEVTYNLHIVLRYEMEKAMINKEVSTKDLPALWNELMKRYLDITPKHDGEGILQDTHWAQGLIGYFPTYTLGNLYAAQMWKCMRGEIRGISSQIERGSFQPILAWLRKHIHQHGRRYHPADLLKRATGKKLDASHFITYLKKKYGEVYRITRW